MPLSQQLQNVCQLSTMSKKTKKEQTTFHGS